MKNQVDFEYTPEELNLAVYQARDAEKEYQKARDEYEILRDSSKDLLSKLMSGLHEEGMSEIKLDRLARSQAMWQEHQDGLKEAKQKLGEANVAFSHAKRVVKAMTTGISFKKELLKNRIVDQ